MKRDKAYQQAPFALGISIKHKIMLNVIIVIFIAVAAGTYISASTESEVFHRSLIHKGENIAKNIASSTKSAFWSLNWIFVENLLRDSANASHDDIIYTKIVKPNGEVYLANDQKYYGKQVGPDLLEDSETVIHDHPFEEEGHETGILLIHPVPIGKETWYILLGLSTDPIQNALKSLVLKNVTWGSIFLLLSATASFFLSRSISKPIVDLAEATKAISDGRRSHSIRISGRDEIGLLGHSFNKMIQSIENAEQALIASNDRFVTVLNSIDATIYVADLSTYKILFMNRAIKDIFGADREGELCYKVFRGSHEPCEHCTNKDLLDVQGNPAGVTIWEGYNPLVQRWYVNYDRAIKWIDNRIVRIQIAFDTTKIKKLEQKRSEAETKLRQSHKMEAIGKLAGGVAHDLNNILSGIVSYPELLLLDLPQNHPMRKPIQAIQDSGKRAATIVDDLLTLARRGVAVNEIINLNDVILKYLNSPEHKKMLSFHIRVKVELSLADDLKMINGSPVHLGKTLMNLVSNAAEAMPDGGVIRIATGHRELDESAAAHGKATAAPFIFLKVSDEGIGITEEDQEKIFEPFYTKKIMGRSGTGLGMAVVWGTVEDHCGHIDIRSQVGEGTTFHLYFPMTDEEMPISAASADLSSLKGNGEKILLVDDVKEQREIGSLMLKRLDYDVEVVPSGEDAIAFVRRRPVDLIVLDMIMDPGISGLETYRRIADIHPGQRAIIASGYSESEDVKKAQALGAGGYLRKPYAIEMLAEVVRQELKR